MNSRVINKYIIKERLNDINLKEQQINDLVTYFSFGTRKQWRSFTSSSDNKTNIVKDHIKNLKDRVFSSKKSFANKRGEEFFSNDFSKFLEWWVEDKHGNKKAGFKEARDRCNEKKCFYCGITEKELKEILAKKSSKKHEPYEKNKYHLSKKYKNNMGWNSNRMEIEKLDPNAGYTAENCVFACHLCNNAKTDIIEASDFSNYIAKGIMKYYKSLK